MIRKERLAQIQALEKDIRKLNDKRAGGYDSDEERAKKKAKKTSHLEEELARYEPSRGLKGKRDGKGRKARDEGDILARLDAFRGKLKVTLPDDDEEGDPPAADGDPQEDAEEPPVEVDDDTDFMSHKLRFAHDNDEEVAKAEREYEVIDPRQRSARAKEEERQRKSKMKPRDGGRGYRR